MAPDSNFWRKILFGLNMAEREDEENAKDDYGNLSETVKILTYSVFSSI